MNDWVIGGGIIVVIVAVILAIMFVPALGGVWNMVLNRQDLSKSMHALIDPVNPTALDEGVEACESVSGTPRDDATAVGCFGMPVGTFDTSQCSSILIKYLQAQCEVINGARWICTSTDVGCLY